jgi:phosphoglycerate kinase
MAPITTELPNWNLNNARVILRADLNVPVYDGKVINDFRLQAFKPTVDYLLAHNAHITILTHIGRPEHQNQELSTRHLMPWFIAHNYDIQFAPTIEAARSSTSQVTLLENLRFWPEERDPSKEFARELATLGDYYVNDAFGVMHRNDTSITLLPQEFDSSHRSIGFLVEREITALETIRDNPEQPFVAILGGGKVHDKIPLIEKLIDKATMILLCPAIVFSFEKARGTRIGKSYVDDDSLSVCREILNLCEKKGVALFFPVDYQIALETLHGPLSCVDADKIPANAIGTSIGPKTLKLFSEAILNAQTIFFNGVFGFLERKDTLDGARKLIELIAQSPATSIIAGGDTAAVAQAFGLLDKIDYVSTGGGATLAYIAGQDLPGLKALEPCPANTSTSSVVSAPSINKLVEVTCPEFIEGTESEDPG